MLVVALLTGLGFVESTASAQWVENPAWTLFVPATAVSFAISTDRNRYSLSETITFKYRIVNISNHALYVPRTTIEGCPTVTMHVTAWLEDSMGRRNVTGWGVSCAGSFKQTVSQRMNKEAVLLKPGEHSDGTAALILPTGITSGAYRIEAMLYGWDYERFTEQERMELATIGNPLLRGEIPASIRVTVTP